MELRINFTPIKTKIESATCPVHDESPTFTVKSKTKFSIDGCCENFIGDLVKQTENEISKQTVKYMANVLKKLK